MTVPPLPKSFEDAARMHEAIEEELERICTSRNFRSSRKSCEFLRYVVRVTLDGRVDSLKERSIGIDLFGRDTSYDPSSDATVRVRANEVRKRLASFYASSRPENASYKIHLPAGGYVPEFVPWIDEEPLPAMDSAELKSSAFPTEEQQAKPHRNFQPLDAIIYMRPAFIALFLCVLLLRQQIVHRGNHLLFWDHLLQGRNTVTISFPENDKNAQEDLEHGIAPLIWLSGRYGVYPHIDYGEHDGGTAPEHTALHISFFSPPELLEDRTYPYAIVKEKDAPILIHRSLTETVSLPKRAAILSFHPGANGAVWIQGTDGEAIRKLLENLIHENSFPKPLLEGIEGKRATETVLTIDDNGVANTRTYGPVS